MYLYDDAPRIKDVFLYVRQSTDERDGKQVRSKGDQQSDCEDLAVKLGLNIVEIFIEERSAKKPHNRPVFKAMLKALAYKDPKRRRADGVLSWHPNRLSRNALEAGMILQMIDDGLIKDMFFPAYSFHNDPSGIEHLFMEFARAKGYSDHLSVAVSRGSQGREKEGAMVYPVKFGYVKRREVPRNPKLCSLFPIPCDHNFPILQRIFRLRLEGKSVREIITTLKSEGVSPNGAGLSKSIVSKWLRDPFYYGNWVINAGTKKERNIDLRNISLPDGTQFTPVISETEFWECQRFLSGNMPNRKMVRYTNPINAPVICNLCQTKMYPANRKIRRSNEVFEHQLGYECQTKDEKGVRCPQCRVKADIIFDHIADTLKQATLGKREYHQFLIGLDRFLEKKKETLRRSRIKLSRDIKTLQQQKTDLLHRKSILIEAGEYSPDDRAQIKSSLDDINARLRIAQKRYTEIGQDTQSLIMGFKQFLERCQRLHETWTDADYEKKRIFTEEILLNLVVEKQEIRSSSWQAPFSDWLNGDRFLSGAPADTNLEPRLERLWEAFTASFTKRENTPRV